MHRYEVPPCFDFKQEHEIIKLIRDAVGIAILAHPHKQLCHDVYCIGGIDHQYTFRKLIAAGYVPITCNSSPITAPVITDSETEHNKANLLKGTFECNWLMDTCTIKITDTAGEVIQQAVAQVRRRNDIYVKFDLQQFVTEASEVVRGSINPTKLANGTYHCTVTFRLVTGQEITVRDFDFEV